MSGKCLDCGKPIKRPKHGRRLLCRPCAKQRRLARDRERSALWRAANRKRHRAACARWHELNRKNDPAWWRENKRRAKTWRKRNAERIKEYNATRRPALNEAKAAA